MKKHRNKIILICIAMLSFLAQPVLAQKGQNKLSDAELEKKHDDIVGLMEDAYVIIDKYPTVTYTYEYDNGELTGVEIENVPNYYDRSRLESCLMDMEALKNEIMNQKTYAGIYYVTEKEPEPKVGYKDFYEQLHASLEYPSVAEERNVEGTVFVKFVVEADGDVRNITATDNIDTPFEMAEKEMVLEAKKAVLATSGEWEPATIGGVPVEQWVDLPVRFRLEETGYPLY